MVDEPSKPAAGEIGDGLGAAIEIAMVKTAGHEGHALVPARQLGLLPEPNAEQATSAAAGEGGKAVGRPKGALNKRTSEWVDYIEARYRSPLIFLAECFNRPARALAAELNCEPLEAYKVQVDAAKNLAPFLHQKQPLAVQVDGKGVVQLILEDPSAPSDGAGRGGIDEAPLLEAKVIQGDSQ
jgi:hypothetical protein